MLYSTDEENEVLNSVPRSSNISRSHSSSASSVPASELFLKCSFSIVLDVYNRQLERIDERFDFVYSSLAFHYVENFNKLIRDIYNLLNRGGELQFSQEHPIVTATKDTIGGKNNYCLLYTSRCV